MISKFFVRQVLYEFFIACPGLFSVLIFICFAHAGSLQVFSLGSLRVSLCIVSKTDNWVNCNSFFIFIFGKYMK